MISNMYLYELFLVSKAVMETLPHEDHQRTEALRVNIQR